MGSPKLLCVLAHPDDESLGFGGIIARYAGEGVEIELVCATRGEKGRFGTAAESPGPEIVGRTRELELRAAAEVLGIRRVHLLGFMDGELDQVPPARIIPRIAQQIRTFRPDVVVTFGPEGGYGHPDHIAISQFTTAAVQEAAAAARQGVPSHSVSKLYYLAWPSSKWEAYQAAFKQLRFRVDSIDRQATPWPDWAITTRIDTAPYWNVVWTAICKHESQMAIYRQLENLPETEHRKLWGSQEFYRVFSLVNGGRTREEDLFAGLALETAPVRESRPTEPEIDNLYENQN